MRLTASLTAGAAVLVLTACQPSNKPQPLTGADSTAITKIVADYAAAVNKGNVDGVVALYTADGVLQMQDTVALNGANAIRTYMNSSLGTPTRPTEDIKATMMVGRQDLAVAVGTFTVTLPAPAAPARGAAPGAPAPLTGKWISALMKQPDGTWKITYLAPSLDARMPMPSKK